MDSDVRDDLWSVILDVGRDNLRIPRRLEWSTAPRSRESLNATEGSLDHSYFAPAYPPYGEEGERLARERNPFSAPRPLPDDSAQADSPGEQRAASESAASGPTATPARGEPLDEGRSTATQGPRERAALGATATAARILSFDEEALAAAAAVPAGNESDEDFY